MSDIFGCICSKCKKWHSHISKNKDEKYICINCKHKLGDDNGRGKKS